MKRVLSICLASLAALTAWGQTDANRAQLYGTVLDPQNAVVPGATINVKNVNTGLERTLTSSGEGQYRAVQLDPGEYEVVAEGAGFAPATVKGLILNVGSAVNADIQLQVRGMASTVDVLASLQSVLETAPQTLISSMAIQDLPINGRRFQDFATLTPTVQVDPSRGQISFAGQRAINSNIMLDGADYSQPFFGGIRGGERSNYIPTVPQSAVQEFQAVTTGYAAEYGRSTGGILNVITRSGTNEWHGEAFYQNRNASLSANGPIPVPDLAHPGTLHRVQPAEGLQQWGGSAGGPLMTNKLFLFSAYEQQHAVQPRQVVFNSLIGYTPTAANQPGYDFMKSLEQKFNKTNDAGAGIVKSDYIFTNGSRLTLRYNDSGSEEPNAVTVGGAIEAFTINALSNEGVEKDKVHFGTAQYTAILSPALINDLKFSGSYEERPRLANSALPSITVGNIGNYGARSFLPTVQWDRRYQITDSVSWTRGSHNVKIGTDIAVIDTAQTFGFNQFGAFNINSTNAGQILDIISGAGSVSHRFDSSTVSYNRQIGNLDANYGEKLAALFVQDSWRVTQNLTLDLGFRWEGQFSPTAASNNTALVNKVDAQRFIVGSQLNVTKIADQTDQFMPRFGFAWSPLSSHRLVVRGHTGIFYAATPLLLFSDPTANFRTPPNNVSLLLNNSPNGTVYTQLLNAGVNLDSSPLGSLPVIPVATVQAASAYGLGGSPRDPFIGASTTTFASNYKNPRSAQGGLGAAYQIGSSWTAGVDFNYLNTVHLERNRDYNQPYPVLRASDASQRPYFGTIAGTPRPISTLGSINVRESSAHAMYRGMNLSAQYRGKKLQFGFSYALAETFSDDDNERDSGGATAANTYDYRPEYNYSNLDARHNFGTYVVYRLPWGLEVSGLAHYRTGLPFSPVTGSDDNADGVRNDRPYTAAGTPFLRNSFRNRGVAGDDLRVMKSFRLHGENMRLDLSGEFFNFLNIANVVYGANAMIYGAGLKADGTVAAIDPRFMRLRAADGRYDTQNSQLGFPFQAQFGARFFF